MTTKQTESPEPEAQAEANAERLFPESWPPSNNFILVAVLLLVATALAVVVSTEETANRLARYAYYFLAVGVFVRLVEQTVGDRIARFVRSSLAGVKYSTLNSERTGGEFRERLEKHAPTPLRTAWTRYGTTLVGRGRSGVAELRERNADTVFKTTALAVFTGGAIQLFLWWQKPWTQVSSTYIVGWVFVVATLTGAYVLAR